MTSATTQTAQQSTNIVDLYPKTTTKPIIASHRMLYRNSNDIETQNDKAEEKEDDKDWFCEITWNDGRQSLYPVNTLNDIWNGWGKLHQPQLYQPSNEASKIKQSSVDNHDATRVVYWTGWDETTIRSNASLTFNDLIYAGNGSSLALHLLYKYGILLITDTPVHDEYHNGASSVAAISSCLSGGSIKNNSSLITHYHYKQQYQNKRIISVTDYQNEQKHNSTNDTMSLPHGLIDAPPLVLPNGTDGPMRTLFGGVWSTTAAPVIPSSPNDDESLTGTVDASTSYADSAYSSSSLLLHTDLTYHNDPPGLQIFTMKQPATKSDLNCTVGQGESVFADGFAAALRLFHTNPHAFQVLSTTVRTYRSIDPINGWNLQAQGPIITLHHDHHPKWDGKEAPKTLPQFRMIRHNDLDRLPDLLPPAQSMDLANKQNDNKVLPHDTYDEFYSNLEMAHDAWNRILADDEHRLVMSLQAGDTIVVANQRCLHGRYSFKTSVNADDPPRTIIGCYVSQDELNSRFRMEGLLKTTTTASILNG